MAQPSGGTDFCGHSLKVFQGLSHGAAKRPSAARCLCPGDNSHLPDPCHGQPSGAQDQERGRQLLRASALLAVVKNIMFWTCARTHISA